VLNIGGVSIGSFWSKMIDAVASIRKRLLTCSLALTENVTKPCPSVPLFGGRKPMLGSTGASPARDSSNAECTRQEVTTKVYVCLAVMVPFYSTMIV